MVERINKARYWQAVLYPENMEPNWQDKIADVLQLPFAYCIHDKDLDKQGEQRKPHVHLIVVYPNTTTYKHALEVFNLLGEKALNTCEACVSIGHCYNYLIHDTEACKKVNENNSGELKYSYDVSERITGNNFDIGFYEQISQQDKNIMLEEILNLVVSKNIMNMADFYLIFIENYGNGEYFEIMKTYNALIDRLTRGNYLKCAEKKNEEIAQEKLAACVRREIRNYVLEKEENSSEKSNEKLF